MKFNFKACSNLPALAWCVQIAQGCDIVEVTHGHGVECYAEYFFEGCWVGDMGAEPAINSSICAASGVAIRGDSFIAFCPTNTLARLHAIKLSDTLWLSNSMAFAVAASGQAIQPDYLFYQEDMSSVIDGLDKVVNSVPLHQGVSLDLFYHCNIEIDLSLNIKRLPKSSCPSFNTFAQYRDFLAQSLASLLTNAKSAARSIRYDAITSISRGYDSATCAVLAKEAGCKEAVTFFDNESNEPDADNGAELASALGLTVTALPRTAYRELQNEYEFLALGTGGEDAFFSSMEDLLKGRVFISGFHGDKVWDKNLKKISDQIVRGDPSGADLEEFRLRTGFIHVAIPFFACREPRAIYELSNSKEMLPWSIGTDYDRPICRRIAEEAGLVRESFGQKKRVMSRSFRRQNRLDWYFGDASLAEFREFCVQHPLAIKRHYQILHQVAVGFDAMAEQCGRISYRLPLMVRKLTHPLDRYLPPFDHSRQLFAWAFGKVLGRYREAVQDRP